MSITDLNKRVEKVTIINSKTTKNLKALIECHLETLDLDLTKIDDICYRDEFLLFSKSLLKKYQELVIETFNYWLIYLMIFNFMILIILNNY